MVNEHAPAETPGATPAPSAQLAASAPAVSTAPAALKSKKPLYKAGELSRRTGLTRQALHQYVLMGLLEPEETTKGGQRLFAEDAEARVNMIRRLCANGYTLKSVKDYFFRARG